MPLFVNDATKDERFTDNPLVTGNTQVIFYAGVPPIAEDGHALGSLCVIDNVPNKISKKKRITATKTESLQNNLCRLYYYLQICNQNTTYPTYLDS